jgi:hypothetical protein
MKKKCCIKKCKKPIAGRGLCASHQAHYNRRVKKGLDTWSFLELCGLALPPKHINKNARI